MQTGTVALLHFGAFCVDGGKASWETEENRQICNECTKTHRHTQTQTDRPTDAHRFKQRQTLIGTQTQSLTQLQIFSSVTFIVKA